MGDKGGSLLAEGQTHASISSRKEAGTTVMESEGELGTT